MSFRNRSVRDTLRAIILLTSTSALLLACFAFVAVDLVGSGRTLRSDLEILTDIVGANTAASLLFGDRESANTVLASLSSRPTIVSACLYAKNGNVFAPYTAPGSKYQRPLHSPQASTVFTGRYIEVTRPVMFDGEIVGTLSVVSDLRDLTTRIRRYALAALVILIVSLLLALVVSQPLQKILSDPILHLARVANRVRSEKDYSVRAKQSGRAAEEIEVLILAFDEMLAEIHTRDAEVEERRANLELQVAERTRELRIANSELTRARDEAQEIADANENLARHKQAVLNTAGEGIFGLDEHGVATFINRSAAQMLGTSIEELIGRPLHSIIHDPEMAALPLDACPVCSPTRHPPRRTGSATLITYTGTTFPIEYTTSSMRDDDVRGGAVVTFRDITERRGIERMKDEFISTVSHELRTPLTSIRGALGLLGSGLLGDVGLRANRMLEIAVTNTDRLVRLINDILDLERISSGQVELHRSPTAASTLVCDSIDVVQNLVDRAGVSIVCEGVDAVLWVDRDRIVQTLTNLIGNAVKFSPEGTTVRVGGEVQGSAFTFFVSDEGRGIPKEKLELIFERFKQVNASDSRDKGGSGLGLAICRSIVDAHGGRIWAESDEKRGSTFRFSVPLAAEESAKVTPYASPYVLADTLATASGVRPVLIVEDDADLARVVAASLEDQGLRTMWVATGGDAIAACSSVAPALVVLDLGLPDVDGFGVVQWMREQQRLRDVPLLVYSARDVPFADQARLQLGPTEFLTKSRTPLGILAERVLSLLKERPTEAISGAA